MNTGVEIASFSHKGHKPNQEDCISYGSVWKKNPLTYAVVCDGLGGHANGEVASKMACSSISEYIENMAEKEIADLVPIFQEALEYLYGQFESYDKDNRNVKRMGTTLACVLLYKSVALCAHIGDSRIYHIRTLHRNVELLYKSIDHSLVNDLIALGKIKPEEARCHPQRHKITRAVLAYNRVNPTIHLCDDVKPGDYFFLCTDGVLEQMTDSDLHGFLQVNSRNEVHVALNKIEQLCASRTNDNYSCCLLQVKEQPGNRGRYPMSEYIEPFLSGMKKRFFNLDPLSCESKLLE